MNLQTASMIWLATLCSCALSTPDFGRRCKSAADCESGSRCVQRACVPPDFEGGEGEGVGEGEGEGEGEGDGEGEGETSGEDCDHAIPLPFDVVATGTTQGGNNDIANSCTTSFNGADMVYAIDMPAANDLRLQVDTSFNFEVYVLQECLAEPVAGSCDGTNLGHVDYVIPDPPDGALFIVIDGFNGDAQGPYSLEASALPL